MKKSLQNLIAVFLLFIGITANSQNRYLDDVFQNVTITSDIQYAENISVLPVVLSGVRNLLESSYREDAVEALNRDNENLRREIDALKAENSSLKAKLG